MNKENQIMLASDIVTRAPFKNVFTIQSKLLATITDSMKAIGFDVAFPLIVWMKDKPILLDGHTRLEAALRAGILEVPVSVKEFDNEDVALAYAISLQLSRRNLSNGEMLRFVHEMDRLKQKGRKLAHQCANLGKSARDLGETLGISARHVEQLRKIDREGSPEVKKALEAGDISVKKAYSQTIHKEDEKQDENLNLFPEENGGDPGILQDDRIRFTKKRRMKDIPETIGNAIEERIKREKKNYPDIRYTEKEISVLVAAVTEIVKKQLSQLA